MNLKKMVIGVGMLFWVFSLSTIEVKAHEWMAPKSAADVKNPIKMDSRSIEQGRKSYIQNCAACHGENMEGLSAEEVDLEISPPSLKKRILTHSDSDFFWKIQEGRGEMPSFKTDLNKDEIWHIINYIRTSAD